MTAGATLHEIMTENKRWLHRLNLVTTLSEWVEANLSPNHIVWEGQERDKKRARHGRSMKAAQYVYAHLMIGRMLYPHTPPDGDPLFCADDYPNESMQLQLRQGAYTEFQAQVQLARSRVMNPTAVTRIPTITWPMVLRKIQAPHVKKSLQRFARTFPHSREILIGLVLRYLCVGGLDDNLHASITRTGAEAMGEHCVECFASPFNHKFPTYFSMFEEDQILGSQGNFFEAVARNGNKLPTEFQRFEMNPPWINTVYERLVEIVDASLASGRTDLEIVVLAPQWVITRWIPGFSSLLDSAHNAAYATHSITPQTSRQPYTVQYVHDLTDTRLYLRTVSWVFTCSEVPAQLRDWLAQNTELNTRGGMGPVGEGNIPEHFKKACIFK